MEQTQILIADDNPEIREIIKILLEGEGYRVFEASDGTAVSDILSQHEIDLIILDIMMPKLNGYQTCVEIRKSYNTPILFLSAKTKESDKTLGFSSGGDDYLSKPFSYNELVSRTKALLRRYQVYRGKKDIPSGKKDIPSGKTDIPSGEPVIFSEDNSGLENDKSDGNILYGQEGPALLTCRHLKIDPAEHLVFAGKRKLDLTDTEYEILFLLVSHPGQIFSAEHLYESVWNEPYYYGAGNTIMVHIRNLRRKIEKDPANPLLIKTVWGKGYRCDAKTTRS